MLAFLAVSTLSTSWTIMAIGTIRAKGKLHKRFYKKIGIFNRRGNFPSNLFFPLVLFNYFGYIFSIRNLFKKKEKWVVYLSRKVPISQFFPKKCQMTPNPQNFNCR